MKSRDLKPNEIAAILKHLPTLRDQTLFLLGVKTGFRISELLSITVSDVTEFGAISSTVTVKRSNTKGKRSSRTVPLHREAQALLERYTVGMSIDDKLFPITRQHAWRIIKEASHVARIQGCISTHSMRKTLGMSVYTRCGKSIVAAQRALGHASLASTSHYLSIGQDEVDAAILA